MAIHLDSKRTGSKRCRKGSAMLYMIITLGAIMGLMSLAVDLGRVQVVKTQLQICADAAARYGITGLGTGISTVQSRAATAAAENLVEGAPHILQVNDDVEFGTWDQNTRTFTPLTGASRANATAIRVTARRTKLRGNPIELYMARFLGVTQFDVTATATASLAPVDFAVVGLDFIKTAGNSTTAYWSTNGNSAGNFGNIASNGNITLSGTSSIRGNAYVLSGNQATPASAILGQIRTLAAPLSYPNGSAGIYAWINDNNQFPSNVTQASSLNIGTNRNITVPGGNYYFNNVQIDGTVNFTGPATLYCYGSFQMGSGRANTANNYPKNLKIVMVPNVSTNAPPGSMNIGSQANLYATIYAPQSAITLGGSGDIYGNVVGKSIDMTGSSAIHYDLALNTNGGVVALVQ